MSLALERYLLFCVNPQTVKTKLFFVLLAVDTKKFTFDFDTFELQLINTEHLVAGNKVQCDNCESHS